MSEAASITREGLVQMRRTRRCVPPGHIWTGKTLGVRQPGDPCQCGEASYEPFDPVAPTSGRAAK